MSCSYISKNGIKCNNLILKESKYCHLKTHYPNKKEYNDTISKIKKLWFDDTFDCKLFDKQNVRNNGWCFYDSVSLSLLNLYNNNTKNKDVIYFFKKFDLNDKKISKILHLISEKLFFVIIKWIKDNLKEVVDETKEKIDSLVNSKDIENIKDYLNVSSIDDIMDDNELKYEYWGGTFEKYVILKIFNLNIITFIPTNHIFDRKLKQYKIKISKNVRKNITRYKLTSSFVKSEKQTFLDSLNKIKDNIDKISKETIFLLLYMLTDNDGDNLSHYNHLSLNI